MTEPDFAGSAGLAIFDFDRTLIRGDSLMPFLTLTVGAWPARRAAAAATVAALTRSRPGGAGQPCDLGSAVKAGVIARTLTGVALSTAHAAAERLAKVLRWHQPMVDRLHAHHRAGHRIVIASGSLDLYLRVVLRALPVDDLLATEVESVNGVLTGRLQSANCTRRTKAARVAAFLAGGAAQAGPTWGYGNRPDDLPMLALLDQATVV